MRIAIDLDGVIVDKPPLIPKKLIEWLFRGGRKNGLHYRFPTTRLEQLIRKLSHFYLLRPAIDKNINFLKKNSGKEIGELFIVSARYSFLEQETKIWLRKRGIGNLFSQVYLNLKDEQPHFFKEKILKKLKVDIFIDDDHLLADYLIGRLGNTRIYCLSSNKTACLKAENIKSLQEVL